MARSFDLQKKKRVAMPQWSELEADVLELILKRLAAIDIIRFKAVCKRWNIAASSYVSSPLYTPMLQTPWIMFHYNCIRRKERSSSLTFFSLTENKPFKIKKDHEDNLVLGSSHGWLLNFNVESKTLYLNNPFSSSEGKIQLPLIDCNFFFCPKISHSVVLSSDPSRSKNFPIAIMSIFFPQRLSFWDHGDTKWRSIDILFGKVYEHMVCHKGEIYAFSRSTRTFDVWDFHGVSPKQTFNIERFPQTLHEQWKVPKDKEYAVKRRIFLVESCLADILFVDKVFLRQSTILIIGFIVYKLNLSERRWMPLQGLSDQAILVGDENAVLVSTRDFPEFEENSIYYGDDYDMRVYSLKEKKVIKSYPLEKWKTAADSSFWAVPTLSP